MHKKVDHIYFAYIEQSDSFWSD